MLHLQLDHPTPVTKLMFDMMFYSSEKYLIKSKELICFGEILKIVTFVEEVYFDF